MEGEGMQVVLDAIKEERSDDPARIRQFLSTIDQNHIRN
jgi:hypothetical protein